MITFTHVGDFRKTDKLLNNAKRSDIRSILERYAKLGVYALANSTPVESGKTASSWGYEIHSKTGKHEIIWTNDNINEGVNIAVIIQYGHGTKNGGYVYGIDYVNPAMRPVFEAITNELVGEVIG